MPVQHPKLNRMSWALGAIQNEGPAVSEVRRSSRRVDGRLRSATDKALERSFDGCGAGLGLGRSRMCSVGASSARIDAGRVGGEGARGNWAS